MTLNNALNKLSQLRLPLATRISIQIGVPVVIALVVLVSAVIIMVRHEETDKVNEQTRLLAKNEALQVSDYLNSSARVAADLATTMESFVAEQSNDRQAISRIMERTLKKSSSLLSVWCAFEPNTLYSPDSKYINTPYGNDKGRYTTGFNVARGYVNHDVTNEDGLVPGDGDWYLIPRDNAKDTLVDPYDYAYYPNTPAFYETSFAVPIFRKGKVIGVAGSDIALNSLSENLNKVKPYGTGYVALIANNGTFATHPNKNWRGKDLGKSGQMKQVKQAVTAGRQLEYNSYDSLIKGDCRYVVSPIKVGNADAQWALLVCVPMKEAMAPVKRLMLWCLIISLVALAGLLTAVVVVANQIARPIMRLTAVATSLSKGDIAGAEDMMKAS